MNFRLIIILIVIISISLASRGQYYDTGEDPASVRWQQIKTERYTLVFPESYGSGALKYARSLDNSFSRLSALYNIRKTRFPVIIHNYTTFSNGYVAWAPKRMEIFPTPEQNSIPLDPVDQLAIHELTHIMQMYSLKKGLTGFLTVLLGEQASALAAGLVPMWVLEGGAVFAESALTPSGRGRAPYFQKQLKALETGHEKRYSYDKMLLGSYRDYVPDYYQYGYQMVAWGYSQYGQELWSGAFNYAGRYPFTIYPVSLSNKKRAGLSNAQLYNRTFDTLNSIWTTGLPTSGYRNYKTLYSPENDEYINYYSPVVTGRDSIVAIKTSLFSPPSFVLINPSTGKEKRIHIPGEMYPRFLSGTKRKIAWVEQIPDPRWNNRGYSVIKIMNLNDGKVVQLSRNSRYMAAALSPDGRFIAASENSVENRNRLVIIDAFNGQILKTSDTPENIYLQRPQWSPSGDLITFISLSEDGEGILSYSNLAGSWKFLLSPSREDIQATVVRNDTLFYVSSLSGTDNIFFITPGGEKHSVTDSRYGAYDLWPAGSSVYFSDYTASGYRISSAPVASARLLNDQAPVNSHFIISRFDTLNKEVSVQAAEEYKLLPYRKWMHPFRFHSWMPFYADIEQIQSDPASVRPGFTLLSQNTLSTLITSVGYEYSDDKHQLHTKITWKGWLPVIESRVDYGQGNNIYKLNNQAEDPRTVAPGVIFTNSISLPLSFSNGRFSQYLRGSLQSTYRNNYIYLKESGYYDYGQTQLTARLFISNQHRSAFRDIYPRWGQVLDLSTTFFPADRDIYGPLASVRTAAYFPGFLRNHGIRLRFEADRQEPEKLLLYNKASFPRGYEDIISLDLRFVSADYVMPLFYPDLNIPGLLYVKRLRAGLFYDYAEGTDNTYYNLNQYRDYTESFRSFGTELLADFNILRIPFTISAGVQSAWRNLGEAPSLKMIFRIDIYGMKIGRNGI